MPTLSIVTATYNAASVLPQLIESLLSQTDPDFEWVVADGGSTDETLDLLAEASSSLACVVVDSRPDFGIYDALNRAVRKATGEYYLVAGADDIFFQDAVSNYKKAISQAGTDFVTSRIRSGRGVRGPRVLRWSWLYGPFAYVSSHAVGLATRRTLHQVHGYYDRQLPVAADQLFILRAIRSGATVSYHEFVAGRFESQNGASGQDVLGCLLEGYRAQVATGHSLLGQTLLLFLRMLKNWRRLQVRR
ncbi:hypothetical protein B1C78_08765 [Thioalkalivibrio denitrificans]|uniref:Glycosyltransferase 2-like domain-containing protein n=1 Tax=Thioalkalivibrio denitrificans TaxID=108003 RepID=A0A1V3NH38_9GAMM|nr:hypothetical protein B1C78_08765 [Thioalkalivibrio denitrificans]